MSRERIVETGPDGKPHARWADPTSSDEPRFGHMEPAYQAPVERRFVAPEPMTEPELAIGSKDTAARRADDLARGRANGAARTSAIYAARRGESPREHAVIKPPTPLEELSIAAAAAADAMAAKEAADVAWDIARAALADAWRSVSGEVLDVTFDPVDEARQLEPTPPVSVRVLPTKAPRARHQGKAAEAKKAERAARVMAALERHGGDRRAAAAELGMKANAVAMVAKFARPVEASA